MPAEFRPFTGLQRRARTLALAERASRRRMEAAVAVLRHGRPQLVDRTATPSFEAARPEVTVAVSLYDYADVVTEALDSVAASTGVDFEIVVVDDHSTDDGPDRVRAWMASCSHLPVLLLAKQANEGLGAARNTAFEAARAPLVMVLDADNELAPDGLARLRDALLATPDAVGAYGRLREFDGADGWRSGASWDPGRLCRGNYIDAQAMLRVDTWRRHGGYLEDADDIHGWEDWDLWLGLAERGERMAFVDAEVGRYRVHEGSMLALSNLAHDDAVEALRRRHPTLAWPR